MHLASKLLSRREFSSSVSFSKGGPREKRRRVVVSSLVTHTLSDGTVISWADLEAAMQTCELQGLVYPEGLPSDGPGAFRVEELLPNEVELTTDQKRAILAAIGDQLLEGKVYRQYPDFGGNVVFPSDMLLQLAKDDKEFSYHQHRSSEFGSQEEILRQSCLFWTTQEWDDHRAFFLEDVVESPAKARATAYYLRRLDWFHRAVVEVYQHQLYSFRPVPQGLDPYCYI